MKKLYTVLGRTAHKTHETERSHGSSFGKVLNKTHQIFWCTLFLVLFVLPKSVLSQVNYTQNWNAVTTTAGWSTNWASTTSLVCEGARAVRKNIYSAGTAGAFVSPLLGTSNGALVTMSFQYKVTNWSAGTVATPNTFGTIQVQYGPTATGPWTTALTINNTNHIPSTACATKNLTFTPAAGNLFVRFNCIYGAGDYWMYFDNVNMTQAAGSACSGTPTPGNTVTSSATTAPGGTVNLSLQNFTAGSGVTYQWQSAPTSGGTWTNIAGATAATYTATVTANTWYRCIVTCGANAGTSNPSGVTLSYCAASGTGGNSYITNFVTSGGVTNISNASGFTAGGYANYSPTVSCSQAAGLGLNFTLNYISDPGTKIFIDWNNDLDFNDVGENVYSSNAYVLSTVAGTITVPVGQALGNYRMRIVVDWNLTAPIACPVSINGETEDYTFTVSAPPACIAPTALTSSAITSTSATISWTAASPAPASGYQYFYSTVNTAPTGATIPSGSTAAGVTTANISGLTANTTYYFWVRSNCGGSGTSSWAGSSSFFTGYCIPTITTIGDYISAFSTTGGFTNVSTSGTSTAAYENYTAQVVSQSSGSAVNFSGSYVGGFAGFSIWVDWNNNLVFDAAELMYNAPATAATWTGSFTVPVGQAVGNYRMRIRAAWNALSPPACGNTSYGQTEDYTFTVTTPPACATPTALVGTITSTTDATLTWTAPASAPASGYNYFYSTVNTAPTGSTIPSGSTAAGVTTASISALTPNTTYYFWVQSNCGGTGTSAWAGSSSFVTSFVIPASGNNSYTMCSGNLYDNGGSAGDYQNNWNGYTVLYPSTPGASISISGTTAGESCCDYVNVYNGVGTGSLIGTYNMGTAIPSIVSTAANGALTISFFSDVSVPGAGVNITVACASPCSGTPTPGATTATTTQVFAAGSTTLGIANIQPTGTTYQWQSSASASGPWANIGGATAATYVASPTAVTYYQCIVTCAAASASATSTPIMISVNPYCEPVYTTGKTDGDLISNISIAGTTLSNPSGTAQTNPSYTFFTGQPYYTANLVAANSYDVTVTVGTWGTQGIAAWIDYNDNNIFEASEKIGNTAGTIGTGTGGSPIPANHTATFTINLSCTPPLGTHRMRVRDVYNVAGPLIDPCVTYTWGETEDYLVTIVPGAAFTPSFSATPTTPNCVGTQVTYTAAAGQTNYAWTFPGTAGVNYTLVSGGTSTSNTAVVVYNTSGSNTITMNYASPLGCASSGAIDNTITVGAGTFTTTAAPGDVIWRGASSTDWNTASNWYSYNGSSYAVASGVPSPATRTIIPANNTCVTLQPSVAAATTVNAKDVVIESGATLTMTTGTLNVSGNFVNNGNFVAGTGTVAFNTAATVSGNATTFNNVDLNNGVNFGSNLSTINGVMTMNNNSWVNTNPPIYGISSLLKYNTGGPYGRNLEWSATSGAGYPNDVQVSNNTTINYPNTGGAFSTNLGVRRDLIIDAGSNLYMDYGSPNASGSLTVGRDVTAAGDLSLGNQIGGDIYVGGNWTRTTGNFYANNRAVFFNGATGAQTITKSGGETFPFMVVNKASGNVVLANNVTVTGGLTLTSGLVELGANNLNMGTAALTGGSSTSYVKTASTGVLSRNVGGTATTFPVGKGTYNPAMVTNTGTADIFTLRVIDNVTADGTGVGTLTNEPVVQRTWMVNETTSGGSNVTLRLYWNGAGEEVNAFSLADAFIAHYIASAGTWDNIGFTGQGAGYFETNNITSFSPFTISSSGTFAPLPIELVSFQANCKEDNTVAVTWATASEHNTSHYVVEKSRDGITWSVLGQTTAAGNSTQLLNYEMIDSEKASGTTYYRLTQFDNDGVFEVFDPVSVNCNGTTPNNQITTYPNPSSESFYVSLFTETMEGNGQLTITDASGRPVYQQSVSIQNGNNVFHIGDLNAAPGMYYIQVTQRNTTTDIVKHSLR